MSAGGARSELWSDTESEENEGDELASFEQPPVVGVESLSEMRQRLKRVTIKSV